MANKVTIKEQIEAIAFETLTAEQFDFLRERALKSIRKASGKKVETKTQKENKILADAVVAFIAEKGEKVLAKDIEEQFDVTNQKAAALLKIATEDGRLVKTPAKGSRKATWELA